MKICINAQLVKGAWGGGNQFLKALRNALVRQNSYAQNRDDADVVLFNGYQNLLAIAVHFFTYHRQKRLYRLGPILSFHRPGIRWVIIDRLVVLFANCFADAVVFQSVWSYKQALLKGFSSTKTYSVIGNAVDVSIFSKKEFAAPASRVGLVYSSWSSNIKKGFAYLKFLDDNLDFEKYSFTFIGNTPFQYKNIRIIPSLSSVELAAELREHDIFVSPVEDDACSNALLEGLSSGLPAVALASGGNPEIVGQGGELFSNGPELLEQIDKVAGNLAFYNDRILVKTIEDITSDYMEAIRKL